MNYYYKDNEILTKEDWKNAFISAYNGKENDIHWRAGRSGECLADDFKGIKASGEKTMIDMITLEKTLMLGRIRGRRRRG